MSALVGPAFEADASLILAYFLHRACPFVTRRSPITTRSAAEW
jgi:hypothetical protein